MKNFYPFFNRCALCVLCVVVMGQTVFSQSIYNPQTLYDAPGGLYDEGVIGDLNIHFLDPNYHSVLVNSFFNNPAYRIPATVTFNGITHDSVGIRYKGNSTFCIPNDEGNPKVPYNLDFNYWVSGQKLEGYKKIKLANAWMDPTFAKEITATNVYKKYLPSPEVNLLKVNVQGNYLGLYVNTESVNKQFCEKHFGEKNGVLFKCDPAQVFCGSTTANGNPNLSWLGLDSSSYYSSYDLKSDHGWEELMSLIYTLNFNYAELDSVLNIDRVLWAFAVNTAMLNLDTYNGYYIHNYYLYQTEDGLFQMVPWDLDNAFIGAILGFDYWSPEVVYNYDTYGSQYDPNTRPLFQKLLADPLRRKQFNAHLRTVFVESFLDTASIRSDIHSLHALAAVPATQDFNKLFPMSYYYSNVEDAFWAGWGFAGIMSTINERNNYLLGLPELTATPPSLANVSLTNDVVSVSASSATQLDLMVTISPYSSKFVAYPMNDGGQNGDAVAGDGIYSAVLPYYSSGQVVKYYIRAQNANAMRVSPERAEYEFYMYDPNASMPEVEQASYTVYPNPSNGFVYINSSLSASLNCVVYNLSGQKLMEKQSAGSSTSLDLSAFDSGMYILKINDQIKKIVKE